MNQLKSFAFILLLAVISSCENNRLNINVSSVREEVVVVRFDTELSALGLNPSLQQLIGLRGKYPEFTDLYTSQVLRTGIIADSSGWPMMRDFISDPTTQELIKMTEALFSDLSATREEMISLFRHYRYYFPEKSLPTVYFCISGFNESVFTAHNIVGISLDKYLGPDCVFYSLLDIPLYKQRKMIPGMIPADVAFAWGMTEFEINPEATTLMDHIIHKGKLMYLMEALLPRIPDTLRTGYTAKQLKWCEMNEAPMWNYLVEKQMLFSTRQMDIVRYVNDAPTTHGFPPESPGRTGIWLGRQIIRAYVKRNPRVTLAQLMENQNYQQILNASAYAPQ